MNFFLSYKTLAAASLLLVSSTAFAQDPATNGNNNEPVSGTWQPSLVRDGAYDRTPHVARTLAWQPVREADVMWKKRVWREIDTREKQNMPFRYPGDDQTGGGYFIEILLDAVKKGKIKAYSTFNDQFTQALTKEQIMEKLVGKPDTVEVEDPITGQVTRQISQRDFDPDKVTKYRIKEDWIMDRNLGRMVVRIIGIAPIIDIMDPNTGEYRTSAPLLWIYYPEARPVLAQYEVFNPQNDVQRMTWDDFMEGRYWSGHVIQTSNPFNTNFKNLGYNNMEALYEGQRVEDQILNKQLDMWQY